MINDESVPNLNEIRKSQGCAYQALKIQLSPSHLTTKRTAHIEKLMQALEDIRTNPALENEKSKHTAMITTIAASFREISQHAKDHRWFRSQSNLADALAKFMKDEFNVSKRK